MSCPLTYDKLPMALAHLRSLAPQDPPAFGRGSKGKKNVKTWKLDVDLPKLANLLPALLSDEAVCVVLTCHDPKWTCQKLVRGMT